MFCILHWHSNYKYQNWSKILSLAFKSLLQGLPNQARYFLVYCCFNVPYCLAVWCTNETTLKKYLIFLFRKIFSSKASRTNPQCNLSCLWSARSKAGFSAIVERAQKMLSKCFNPEISVEVGLDFLEKNACSIGVVQKLR